VKILIAGIGSIGRRHLRNLQTLLCSEIVAYRSGRGVFPDADLDGITIEHELEAALAHHPSAVIVSGPTALHLPIALAAVQNGCHLFVEKPVSHSLEGVSQLQLEVAKRDLAVLVGFHFRFHPALRQIKLWLDAGTIGNIVSAHSHWGEYLPGWHPLEDYRAGYSARADLGGGVVLTLCHPFDYLRWLIGEVTSVSGVTEKRTGLNTDVEEAAHATLRFTGGAIGSVYLDYVERPSSHWFQIIGERGTIRWDNSDGVAHLYTAESEGRESFAPPEGFERNTMYLDEMRHFLNCIDGREQPVCTLHDGVRALEIALAVKQSAAERKEIDV
jgi:predicted dehydrogenase